MEDGVAGFVGQEPLDHTSADLSIEAILARDSQPKSLRDIRLIYFLMTKSFQREMKLYLPHRQATTMPSLRTSSFDDPVNSDSSSRLS